MCVGCTKTIRPMLEYGDIVWDNCSMHEQKDLDRIQDEAARIVTGATVICMWLRIRYSMIFITIRANSSIYNTSKQLIQTTY